MNGSLRGMAHAAAADHHMRALRGGDAGVRWGAAALTAGALLFVVGVVLGLRAFAGDWDTSVGDTLPATAALIEQEWATFRSIWVAELVGALLLATAALVLSGSQHDSTRAPLAFVWSAVAVGSTVVAVQYAFTLGSYPPALAAFAEAPEVFGTIRGGVLAAHAAGSAVQLLGLLVILAAELRWRGTAPADRVVQAAAAVATLGILLAATGVMPGELGAAAVFLAAALLGVALWISSRAVRVQLRRSEDARAQLHGSAR